VFWITLQSYRLGTDLLFSQLSVDTLLGGSIGVWKLLNEKQFGPLNTDSSVVRGVVCFSAAQKPVLETCPQLDIT